MSSGGGDAAAYVALGIAAAAVTAGVFILSNEVSLSPVMSLFRYKQFSGILTSDILNWGLRFNLKKNFKTKKGHVGDFEYGYSFLPVNFDLLSRQRTYGNNTNYHQVNVGYNHKFFTLPKNDKCIIFAGPLMNFNFFNSNLGDIPGYDNERFSFGIGASAGFIYKFHDRISLDVRYQITNNSNQLLAGLSFQYQKEYFWKRRRK
jgi:hypothetical protein